MEALPVLTPPHAIVLGLNQLQKRWPLDGIDEAEIAVHASPFLNDLVEPESERFAEGQAQQLSEPHHGGFNLVDQHANVVKRGRSHGSDRTWRRISSLATALIEVPPVCRCSLPSAGFCPCLVDQGLLEVDRLVVDYWPEFGAAGKQSITVGQLLDHSAGVISLPGFETLFGRDERGWDNFDEIARRLEVAEPAWRPGTAHGYHAVTCGYLWNELVRRVSGKTAGVVFREQIADPLALEIDLGTPPGTPVATVIDLNLDDYEPAVRTMLEPFVRAFRDPSTLSGQAFLAHEGQAVVDWVAEHMNNPAVLRIESPFENATGTARAIARKYAMLAQHGEIDGIKVLRPETIELFSAQRRATHDLVIGRPMSRGYCFWLNHLDGPQGSRTMGPNADTFGHPGAGGQVGFADPTRNVAVGFTRSRLTWLPTLSVKLIDAVYERL